MCLRQRHWPDAWKAPLLADGALPSVGVVWHGHRPARFRFSAPSEWLVCGTLAAASLPPEGLPMFVFLHGRVSDRLTAFSCIGPPASEQSPASLSPALRRGLPSSKPNRAESRPLPPATNAIVILSTTPKSKEPDSVGMLTIESVGRGTGESAHLGCAQ